MTTATLHTLKRVKEGFLECILLNITQVSNHLTIYVTTLFMKSLQHLEFDVCSSDFRSQHSSESEDSYLESRIKIVSANICSARPSYTYAVVKQEPARMDDSYLAFWMTRNPLAHLIGDRVSVHQVQERGASIFYDSIDRVTVAFVVGSLPFIH